MPQKVILDLVKSNERLEGDNQQLQAYSLSLRQRMRERNVAYNDLDVIYSNVTALYHREGLMHQQHAALHNR